MTVAKLIKNAALLLGVKESIVISLNMLKSDRRRALRYKFKLKKCGWGTTIDKHINFRGSNISIGEYCVINSFVHIWSGGIDSVTIGDRVLIASHVAITSLTHNYLADDIRFEKPIDKPVIIKDDAWIGAHAVILPGITIGKGAVIGSGAVVTNNIPDFAIAVGVPARVIKYRF